MHCSDCHKEEIFHESPVLLIREVKHHVYGKWQTANGKMKFPFPENTENLDLIKLFSVC